MKRTLIVGLLVSMTVLLAPVRAQQYTNYGAGTVSCGSWIETHNQSDINWQLSWVLGFVSGVGWATGGEKPLKNTDGKGMQVFINQYCAQNPLDHLADAAVALVRELRK